MSTLRKKNGYKNKGNMNKYVLFQGEEEEEAISEI